MTGTVASDRSAKPVSRPRSRRPVTVSASALAQHLDCSRTYIGKLEVEGVIQRRSDGKFDQDRCRSKYIEHLRTERKRSPKGEADTAFQQAKTALINIRIAEKQKVLMPYADHEAFVERLVGLFLSGLSGFAAQIAGRDLAKRRAVDQVVHGLRVQIAEIAGKLADEVGEPMDDAT